jgi:single-stranded DNA-binding protein
MLQAYNIIGFKVITGNNRLPQSGSQNDEVFFMMDCLLTGRLIKKPELKTSGKGTPYCNLLVSVSTGESESTVITGVCFNDIAERLSKLDKGDAVSLAGSLKPTEWTDKASGETRHGLSITVNQSLSVYDISKRRTKSDHSKQDEQAGQKAGRSDEPFYNDDIPW